MHRRYCKQLELTLMLPTVVLKAKYYAIKIKKSRDRERKRERAYFLFWTENKNFFDSRTREQHSPRCLPRAKCTLGCIYTILRTTRNARR